MAMRSSFIIRPSITIRTRSAGCCYNNKFHCSITDILDTFQSEEVYANYQIINEMMKTYIIPPEKTGDKWYIPIRVPGATRGHIEVIPYKIYWKIVSLKIYDESAIIGKSKIGCYKPEVESIIDAFNGDFINFEGFNPTDL